MHRRVRELRLTCRREDDAQHGRVLLDDALRTASLGDETRLIVVRRLDLGAMPLRASATHWSRRIEDVFRATPPVAVRFDGAGAADANAVFFENAHEPWLNLAERLAADQRCPEWFWRPAVPRWDPARPVAETLRQCFRVLAEQGGLVLTLVLGLRLQAQGVLPVLLRCLETSDLAQLRTELASDSYDQSAGRPSPRAESSPRTEAEFAVRWGARDVRTHWLASLVLAHSTASGPANALSPSLASTLVPELLHHLVKEWTDPATLGSTPAATHPIEPDAATRAPEKTEGAAALSLAPTDHAVTRARKPGAETGVTSGIRNIGGVLPWNPSAAGPWSRQ